MRRALIPALIGAALALAQPLSAQQPDGGQATRSASAGVYTPAQAERGKATFTQRCAACHATSMFASGHLENWRGRTAHEWVEQISAAMPFDNPGGLSRAEYVDILAYILQLNALPAGEQELPPDADALKRIRIERDSSSGR